MNIQTTIQTTPKSLPANRVRMTIRDLELSAKRSQCNISCMQVRSSGRTQYLTVVYHRLSDAFTYRWGRVQLNREGADLLLDEMSQDKA